MAGLEVDRKQLLTVIIILAVGGAGAFWVWWRTPQATEIATMQTALDSIEQQVNIARRDLARGTVEDLRQQIADHEASLGLMRVLVPTRNEIPSLLDDIRARAGRRDVRVSQFTPLAVEPGDPFDTHRFRLTVYGRYDDIGSFLADIASLQRIMVPVGLTLDTASRNAQQLYADTSGALLEGTFDIRTFVKRAALAEAIDGP